MRNFGIEIEMLLPEGIARNGEGRREILAQAIRDEGIDCYVEAYGHSTPRNWKVVTDATLGYTHGAEVVSPILDLDADGLEQLEAVCRALGRVNAQIRRECGLHVHHDMRGQDFKTWKNIAKLHAKYENVMDSLVPPSRRANVNRWCKSNVASVAGYGSNNPVADVFAKIDRCSNLDQLRAIQHGNRDERRYHKLNLEASTVHNTVEFRGHGGTIEFEKMQAWILLTESMVTKAKALSHLKAVDGDALNTDKLFAKLVGGVKGGNATKVRRYLRKRRALLGA